MEKWEYKIKEIVMKRDAVKKTGFWGAGLMLVPQNVTWNGDKMITEAIKNTEEFEEQFNNLGKENWELCGTVPITKCESASPGGSNTERVYFIFKRAVK